MAEKPSSARLGPASALTLPTLALPSLGAGVAWRWRPDSAVSSEVPARVGVFGHGPVRQSVVWDDIVRWQPTVGQFIAG